MQPTSATRRINPRRPYVISANGLKRIILGSDQGTRDLQLTRHTAVAKTFRTTQTATRNLLVLLHSDNGMLDAHGKEVIAAAALLADLQTAVVVAVLGGTGEDLGAFGADVVITLSQLDAMQFRPELSLALVAKLIAEYQPQHLFLADRNADGDLGRRLAARCKYSIATDVVEVGGDYALRLVPGGKYARCALPQIVLLARHAADVNLPFIGQGRSVMTHECTEVFPSVVTDLGLETSNPDSISLEEADFIVSAGNGMNDMEAFNALATLLGASVGASRVAVDDGRFSRDKQVGATGKTVQSSVYLALGISGAVQHLQGIKECRHVIAVNLDASAPIAKRANLMVVEDAQALMRALMSQVQQAKQEKMTTQTSYA
ncbi:electron transfer flavoprotein subunit alpha/FixB family protein [Solimicrobium silvestre]|uniref:Electron transfer flavoprotein alpha subunit n=1 Tax=Solimicrobium silvestre TaxID=2099400 RepID=A0A2S9GWA8_9BURK|nr:electron transfer flavoprotein subunit alpha/FixB family protein [Solimicrobium silvestre]PRC91978.1 Electron transfer flavoprotein alpha subunit [Solimicrobium silvestre]